jgi:hypothetical protein
LCDMAVALRDILNAALAFALGFRQKMLDDESALARRKRTATAKANHFAVFQSGRRFHANNVVFCPAVRAMHRRRRKGFHGGGVWITHRSNSTLSDLKWTTDIDRASKTDN